MYTTRTTRTTLSLVSAFVLTLAAGAPAQTLLKDIHPGTRATNRFSAPRDFAAMGGKVYFSADDGYAHGDCGRELWVTDGTPAGTHLVKDCAPGFGAVYPKSGNPRSLIAMGNTLFFTATDGENGDELWKSDGTADGTKMVKNIYPDPSPRSQKSSTPHHMVVMNGTLYFSAIDPTAGWEVWKSDGTEAGTTRVTDIIPGPGSAHPDHLTVMNNAVYFVAHDKANNDELWKTDGTTTSMVKEIHPTWGSFPKSLAAIGGRLYFQAADGKTGYEPWMSDGTSKGTVLLKDVNSGAGGSYPSQFTAVGSTIYFVASDGKTGYELHETRGTTASTRLSKDIYPGPTASHPSDLVAFQNRLYCQAMWKTTWGSPSGLYTHGTTSGPVKALPYVGALTVSGARLFFVAQNSYQTSHLNVSDGTTTGTVDLGGFPSSSGGLGIGVAFNNGLVFAGGGEPWFSNGSVPGTAQIMNIYGRGPMSGSPRNFAEMAGITYFQGSGVKGAELWRTDGTSTGTYMLKDCFPGGSTTSPNSGSPDQLTVAGNKLFFRAIDAVGWRMTNAELWVSDGKTAAGTRKIKEINATNGSSPSELTDLGGVLLFAAADRPGNAELWRSDGTPTGTTLVKEIVSSTAIGSAPRELTALRPNLLIFTADDGVNGREVWRSDGTATGTQLVKNLHSTSTSQPDRLVAFQGFVYFRANDGTSGFELWKTDGTATNTKLVKDISSGSGSSHPDELTVIGKTLYFVAWDATHGRELWKTDGTAGGTRLVMDILIGTGSSHPAQLTAAGQTLFFAAATNRISQSIRRDHLFKSDGTTTGTVLVRKFGPRIGYAITNLIAVGNTAFFSVYDDTYGTELWQSDGTLAGTFAAHDIRPGPQSSNPRDFFFSAGQFYVNAADGVHGRELHRIPVGATSSPVGMGCSSLHPAPTLRANAPKLGKTMTLAIEGRKNANGELFIGLLGAPLTIGYGCTIYFDTTIFGSLGSFVTNGTGKKSISLTVPNVPSSLGETYVVQAILTGPTTPPWGIDFTNGLYLTIGR